MMHMSFYQTNDLILLFSKFNSHNEGLYYWSLIFFVFLFGVVNEWLGYMRFTYNIKSKIEFGNNMPQKYKVFIAVSYVLQLIIAYSLMLCVMSYNVGVFVATILGLTAGNFVFGYRKEQKLENIEYYIQDYKVGLLNTDGNQQCPSPNHACCNKATDL